MNITGITLIEINIFVGYSKLFKIMASFFQKLKEAIGKPTEQHGKAVVTASKPITRQELVDQVFDHYQERFKEETTDESMAFPTSFYIYLHSQDYNAQKQGFRLTAQDVVKKFNKFNRNEKTKYPDHIPHAKHWSFQFVKFDEDSVIEKIETVKMGEPQVLSTLFSTDFSATQSSGSAITGIKMTKRPLNSTQSEKIDVNPDAFLTMEMHGEDKISFDIDKNYQETQIVGSQPFATLNDGNYNYPITTGYVEISGKSDTRSGVQYIKINNDALPKGIIHIRHENDKFQLAAFGKVRLDERLVPVSSGAPNWVDLPNNSKMLIELTDRNVSLQFKKQV